MPDIVNPKFGAFFWRRATTAKDTHGKTARVEQAAVVTNLSDWLIATLTVYNVQIFSTYHVLSWNVIGWKSCATKFISV